MLRLRRRLALLRLGLLYGVFCGLLLGAGLLYHDMAGHVQWLWSVPKDTGLPFSGVNVELESLAPGARRARLQDLQAAGFAWVRQRINWAKIEPQAGVYDWSQPDGWIADIVAEGLVPLVVLDGSPAWARAPQDRAPADNPLAPPADAEDFARFAAAFAARYGDQVQFYQIWDEPNIAPHWGNRWVEPVAYAQLLKAAAKAIRSADPHAVIATAALAPTADRGHTAVDEVYFLQRMLAAGAADAFDAVAIEPLGFGHAPTYSSPSPVVLNFQRAAHVRRAMEAMGIGDKALWAVRFGWNRNPSSPWGAVTPSNQAEYAVAALNLAWNGWPWLESIGWAVERPHAPPTDAHWGFALREPDGSPAPVLRALRGWLLQPRSGERPAPGGGAAALPAWLLAAGGLAVVAWRSAAAARLLPWRRALTDWRILPWPLQAAAWLAALVVYYFATWPPLIGACWLAWTLLCLAQPRMGLALAALLLPFYYQHKELALVNATVVVPPAVAAVACLLPAVVWRAWAKRQSFAAIDAAAMALLAISLLPALQVWQWEAYIRGVIDFVLLPLGLWFGVRVLRTSDERFPLDTVIAAALFGGGVLAAVWGLWAWAGGYGVEVDGVRRLVGPHFSPNHTALYLLRTLFLGVGLLFACLAAQRRRARTPQAPAPVQLQTTRLDLSEPVPGDGWRRLAVGFGGASVLVALALVLTGSRGALLLGVPVGACVFAFVGLRRRPALLRWIAGHRYARWVAFGAALAVGAAVLLLWERLLNQQTIGLRLDLWEASLRLWRDHFLLGAGPGSFPWIYPAYVSTGSGIELNQLHPHNIWLEVAATWGLLGFAWLGVLLWLTAAALLRRWSEAQPVDWLRAGLVAALLAAAAHGQMDAFFLLPDLAAWNALALALLIGGQSRYSAG